MQLLNFIKDYWIIITCLLIPSLVYAISMVQATKCSLRNDVLAIYEKARERGNKITRWELEAIEHSASVYFRLHGNSFVQDIVKHVRDFDIID